eukprot:gene1111-288_t
MWYCSNYKIIKIVLRTPRHNRDLIQSYRSPQCALTEHYRAEHAGQAMKLKIIDLMPTEGIVDRKCTESVVQRTHESSINRRNEGAGHVGDLYY